MNAEVFRDPLDRHTRLTTTRDSDHIFTELFRIRLRHNNILPGSPPGQANSDVT
jgi:hypothetical protein